MLDFIRNFILPQITEEKIKVYEANLHHVDPAKRLEAYFHLGLARLLGHNVPQDIQVGIDYLLECMAEQSHYIIITYSILKHIDQLHLGDLRTLCNTYVKNSGWDHKDRFKKAMAYRLLNPSDEHLSIANSWIRWLANFDYVPAQYLFYSWQLGTHSENMQMLLQAAHSGNASALYAFYSVARDKYLFELELQKACQLGSAPAMFEIAKNVRNMETLIKLHLNVVRQYYPLSAFILSKLFARINSQSEKAAYFDAFCKAYQAAISVPESNPLEAQQDNSDAMEEEAASILTNMKRSRFA